MINPNNLISLVWAANNCCSVLIEGIPKNVSVDLKEETYSFQGQTLLIGTRVIPCVDNKGYPIGVYDQTNIEHLKSMKRDIEWVKERNHPSSGYFKE